MQGYLALVLHAHLPFVRHPEHERFLEENWLFEALTESYLPLLQLLEAWRRDDLPVRLTFTLTPTLCAMLQDPLLQTRYRRYLSELLELAHKEVHRTLWQEPFHRLAVFYEERFQQLFDFYSKHGGDVVGAFRTAQECGQIEIITCAATHALLPLLATHPPSLRAQVMLARDQHRAWFGREPEGIWLPECAFCEAIEPILREANLRWFILDSHGLLHARPQPRYGSFAPVLTPGGLAAFARDHSSAKQIWSRAEGYPGDPMYRDFYRDIGFDLDLDYLNPHLPAPEQRSFTGIKYHRITGSGPAKEAYERAEALRTAERHASHFLETRREQFNRVAAVLERPPLVLAPYDAELFGHWWYEGPEFLDAFVRKTCAGEKAFRLLTPGEYLRQNPHQQIAAPAASSWGEAGYWHVWLNDKNEWIYPHLQVAQERMTELARKFNGSMAPPAADSGSTLIERGLRQAGRELLLAQSSDWPFILRTGTSPGYARTRVKEHLLRFTRIYEQLIAGKLDEASLDKVESQDNLFPDMNWRYWV
jgi:1,4-alpha-glucan branching enzyme